MPYSSVSEVPSYVPKNKRKQWMEVWNSVYREHGDESRAFASANAVAGHKSKKLFKFGTQMTGFTNGASYGPFECGHCMFFDKIDERMAFCGNDEVNSDPDVPADPYGNKVVNFVDCCNEYFPVNLSKGLVMLEKARSAEKAVDEVQVFCPLVKVDAVKREVWGVVTAESPDRENEICDYETTVPYYKAIVDEMSKATDGKNILPLRAMHGLIAAGKGIGIEFRDEAKQIFMGFKVVDDVEWKKVEENVYTGFSQGGRYIKKWKDGEYMKYTAKPSEVSLVDIPCLSTATFEYVKADGTSEMRKFSKTTESMGQAQGEIPSTVDKNPDKSVSPPCTCKCANCTAGDCKDCSNQTKCHGSMAGKVAKKVQYLVTDKDGKGHLPVTDGDGTPNYRLMRTAWAALFNEKGFDGPDKEKAKKKLRQLYAREGKDNPAEKAEMIDTLAKTWTEEAISSHAYGQIGKGMYTVSRFADIVESMKYLWLSLEYEEAEEGDEAEAAASVGAVKEAYVRLLDALLVYTEEQISEEKSHPKMSS